MLNFVTTLIQRKLLVNLVALLIVCVGLVVAANINREAFPEVNFDMMTITTIYPGASPDEIEQLIAIPIEKKLRSVDGIDKLRAYNVENVSVMAIYLEDRQDKKSVIQDIKDAVDAFDKLPARAEQPVVTELKLDKTVAIQMATYAKKPGVAYKKIYEVADALEDFLYEVDGIAEIETIGSRDREYLVEVDPKKLKQNRIGINMLVDKLQSRNIDLPGGDLRIDDQEYVLRTKGQFQNLEEIRDTIIQANDLGYLVRLRDLATVTDTFVDPDIYERYNGRKAIITRVWKKRSEDEIRIVERLLEAMTKFQAAYPEEVQLELFQDQSEFTKERISGVLVNAATGFALLALVLLVLLGLRMSLIVSLSIPISIMVTFIGMSLLGLTINVISLFGMIMVLGMIVDFGIVVSENCHRYMERGLSKLEAIRTGVTEVFWPVTVTLLCISAAFSPLLFLSGLMGKFIYAIPAVLLTTLFASWAVAMFILPTYLNMFSRVESVKQQDDCVDEDENCERGKFGRVQLAYKRWLGGMLKHRYLTLVILIIVLISSLFLGTRLGFVFMPSAGAEQMMILAKMPQGTNLDATLREVKKIEQVVMQLPDTELESLHVRVGTEAPGMLDPKPGDGTNKSTMQIYLTPEEDRARDAEMILEELREKINAEIGAGRISKLIDLKMEVQGFGPPVGKPVNVEIRGESIPELGRIAEKYAKYLKGIEGVRDVTIDLEEGKTEYRYTVNEEVAATTSISTRDIATTLHAAFSGSVATNVQRGTDDIDIRVRFSERARKDQKSLGDVMVANQMDGLVPLDRVSTMVKQPGYSMINRLNFKRIVQVQAEVDTATITSLQVNAMLRKHFKNIEDEHPGYSVAYGGEQEETNESMSELGVLFVFALLVIFTILAVFMNSLLLPIVVMSAIPFGLVGMMLALWAHQETMSFMSTLGFFSLAGVIVSNTLVLVQFINNQRGRGLGLKQALLEAGVLRLRPVLLTSGTTVLALIPTIYGLGGKDHFVAPLALAFGYGLIFATFVTLVLIPCFYHIAEDMKTGTAKLLSKVGINMNGSVYRPITAGEAEVSVLPKPVKTTGRKPAAKAGRKRK